MAVALYMDVHVPWPITDQLRRRGIDVLTAVEDDANLLSDEELLRHATELNRLLFTQDIGFKNACRNLAASGQGIRGACFWPSITRFDRAVRQGLELIARASELDDWKNTVAFLPF